MKPAIFTQYLPAKGTKPARIKAFDHDTRSHWHVLLDCQTDIGGFLPLHQDAVAAFVSRFYPGSGGRLFPATTKHGYVWVYVD